MKTASGNVSTLVYLFSIFKDLTREQIDLNLGIADLLLSVCQTQSQSQNSPASLYAYNWNN